MKLQTLPPAGNPIVTQVSSASSQCELHWPNYDLHWLQSGTASLAYALLHKKAAFDHIQQPEVIVPAYCCPDLLAAAQFAGYTPVIVDINPNDPSYHLEALANATNGSTLAIIAINFMGLKERLSQLKETVSAFKQVSIIEDNAQWFPTSQAESQFESDYVCFSFGRGKAVSLLVGGLVAVKNGLPEQHIHLNTAHIAPAKWALIARLINLLSKPRVYHALTKLTFLNLGQTRYHPLTELASFPFESMQVLNANLPTYLQRKSTAEPILDAALSELNQLQPIKSERRGRLLRYPVLCESQEQRDTLYQALVNFGASKMYATALPQVEGVQSRFWQGDGHVPNAQQFAQRFLTLPVHSGVSKQHAEAMATIIARNS